MSQLIDDGDAADALGLLKHAFTHAEELTEYRRVVAAAEYRFGVGVRDR